MYIYIYVYIYMYIYVYMYIHTYVCIYTPLRRGNGLNRRKLLELPPLTTRPRGKDSSIWPRKTAILEKPRWEGS